MPWSVSGLAIDCDSLSLFSCYCSPCPAFSSSKWGSPCIFPFGHTLHVDEFVHLCRTFCLRLWGLESASPRAHRRPSATPYASPNLCHGTFDYLMLRPGLKLESTPTASPFGDKRKRVEHTVGLQMRSDATVPATEDPLCIDPHAATRTSFRGCPT